MMLVRIFGVFAGLAAVAFAGILLVPAVMGLQRYVITSGSMTGTYDRGSVVFDRVVPRNDLRVGEVVTYQPPGLHELVTHRIVSVATQPGGVPAFHTKGDANTVVDPWTFVPNSSNLPHVVGSVPYIGFAVAALDVGWVRMLIIGLPALLVALALTLSLFREERIEPNRAWSA